MAKLCVVGIWPTFPNSKFIALYTNIASASMSSNVSQSWRLTKVAGSVWTSGKSSLVCRDFLHRNSDPGGCEEGEISDVSFHDAFNLTFIHF